MTTGFKRLLVAIVVATAATASYADQITIVVDARLNGSSAGVGADTGLVVSAGDLITTFAAVDDLWNAGELPRWSNADGLVGNLYATGSDESGEPAGTLIGRNYGTYNQDGFSFPYGALVGKLSNTYFLLGTNFSEPAPADGTLLLYYWDSYLPDNEGSITVTVDVPTRLATEQRVPEPGTLALIGVGLAAGVVRRRVRAA
jgi:hypothetical protein